MTFEIWLSDRVKDPLIGSTSFGKFLQRMANRLVVGAARYGNAKSTDQFLTRLKAEVREYTKTGNAEHLINAANYCFLETIAPEHKHSHFEQTTKSVTRDVLGMRF